MHPVAPRTRVKTQKATHNQSALVGIIEGAALPLHSAVRLCLTVGHSSPFFPEAKPQEKNLGGTVAGKAKPYRTGWRQSRIHHPSAKADCVCIGTSESPHRLPVLY